ncbi:MAG: MFS transporter, partial [Burkholderiales bacterium]
MPERREPRTRANSAWSPLRRPTFRALWLATIVSNIGTWMHEVGAGWLMVTLDPSPLMVSLVQASTILPIFFLSLPAGTLADILDRRVYLIAMQLWMLACAGVLAALTLAGSIGPWTLLSLTFGLAAGAAMMTPAWAATVPELVPPEELHAAIALNSTGVNIARAIGPAIAGVLIAATGPAAAFVANAVSFVGVIVVLARWQRPRRDEALPPERFLPAVVAGLAYVRRAKDLQCVMMRSLGFFAFATAIWSLLPLVAAGTGGGSSAFGLLLGSIGAGAVTAALLLPKVRARISRDALVRIATVVYATAMLVVSLVHSLLLLVPAMLLTGAAWLSILSTMHVSAQTAVEGWVRARALSMYLIVFSIGMTVGAVLWGAVATRASVPVALELAALGA